MDRLLSAGERVDGSSLFSHIDAAASDLYVVPRYKTAYVNPFSPIPAVDILCSYYTSEGVRLPTSPENTLRAAHEALKRNTGLALEAMGELEYYVLSDRQPLYPSTAQGGYHESPPFTKWAELRCEAMQAIAQAGGKIKYGHTEVGSVCGEDREMEQHEIEFLPVPVEDAADQLVVAKWMLRMIGYKYGVTVTLAPKISAEHAGSGLHIHTKLVKDGKNMMTQDGQLSETAKKAIAGYLTLAPSLTAFGNTVPTSYLRLVPDQEAPTNVCWGYGNRSVLVRVPLGWLQAGNMARDANPKDKGEPAVSIDEQTAEFRAPDGSANVHLLLAGLAVAARHGLTMEDALEVGDRLYVDVDIFSPKHEEIRKALPKLPASCWESAECLLRDRKIYEKDGVFPAAMVDGIAGTLKSYRDEDLCKRLQGREDETEELVGKYLHCS